MEPIRVKTVVPRDHRVEISLPPEVPEGPVELEVTVALTRGDETGPDPMLDVLADLREMRTQYAGRSPNLSAAVIELRATEG